MMQASLGQVGQRVGVGVCVIGCAGEVQGSMCVAHLPGPCQHLYDTMKVHATMCISFMAALLRHF